MSQSNIARDVYLTFVTLLGLAIVAFLVSVIPEQWIATEFLRGMRKGFLARAVVGSWIASMCCLFITIRFKSIHTAVLAAIAFLLAVVTTVLHLLNLSVPLADGVADLGFATLWSLFSPITWLIVWLTVRVCFRKR